MFVNFAKDEYIVMCLNEEGLYFRFQNKIFFDFSLTVEAATLIFISGGGGGGGGSAISSAKEGKSGFIHNLVKS